MLPAPRIYRGAKAKACLASPSTFARKLRHEGIVERTFGKQRAKQVGKALRHEKRFGHEAGAQREGNQLVTHKAQERGSPV